MEVRMSEANGGRSEQRERTNREESKALGKNSQKKIRKVGTMYQLDHFSYL